MTNTATRATMVTNMIGMASCRHTPKGMKAMIPHATTLNAIQAICFWKKVVPCEAKLALNTMKSPRPSSVAMITISG